MSFDDRYRSVRLQLNFNSNFNPGMMRDDIGDQTRDDWLFEFSISCLLTWCLIDWRDLMGYEDGNEMTDWLYEVRSDVAALITLSLANVVLLYASVLSERASDFWLFMLTPVFAALTWLDLDWSALINTFLCLSFIDLLFLFFLDLIWHASLLHSFRI